LDARKEPTAGVRVLTPAAKAVVWNVDEAFIE